jgi:hypothetical protein
MSIQPRFLPVTVHCYTVRDCGRGRSCTLDHISVFWCRCGELGRLPLTGLCVWGGGWGATVTMCSARVENYDRHVVMLDTDIVVIGDLLHLFNEEFDYGLSARANLQVSRERLAWVDRIVLAKRATRL